LKSITFEIIRLATIGKSPKEISSTLRTTQEAVRMTLYRQRKIARKSVCFFTGEPAAFPVYFEGKIVPVCSRYFRLFQAGLDSEDCFSILKKSGSYRAFPIDMLVALTGAGA
jgi:hypothetical protein